LRHPRREFRHPLRELRLRFRELRRRHSGADGALRGAKRRIPRGAGGSPGSISDEGGVDELNWTHRAQWARMLDGGSLGSLLVFFDN
jgi:hypothetical protein